MIAWQATVQDESGNVVPLPVVTVYNDGGAELATIYGEFGGTLPNPLTGTLEGFVQFWAVDGRYEIEGANGADRTEVWEVQLGKDGVLASYAAAVTEAGRTKLNYIQADVNGTVTAWVRRVGGTCLGGDWSPAGVATPQHWGAIGNGVVDDSAAFSAAKAGGMNVKTVTGTFNTNLALPDLPKKIDGDSVVSFGTSGENKLAKSWRFIDTAPSAKGNHSGFQTAFNGDWSKNWSPRGVYVTGAATLGQPTTGFSHNEEMIPYYLFMRNVDSGHNESLTGNEGRTTWPGMRIRGMHSGQGGMMGFSSSIFVNGATRPGVTSFLANPAAANISASGFAGADGVYLNPLELNCEDQGFDVAAIGPVINMRRTNKTGALEAFWSGMRIQSIGTEAINSAYQVSGRADTAIDLTKADLASGNNAAIAMKSGHRIYFKAASANNWHKTSNGDTWLSYSEANNGIEGFVDGAEIFRIRANGFLIRNTSLQIEAGNLAIQSGSGIVSIGGLRVLSARQNAIANAAAGTEVVTINTILGALRAHGLIAT